MLVVWHWITPACWMMQVYLIPALLPFSHHASSSLIEMFILNSLETLKLFHGGPGCINTCVSSVSRLLLGKRRVSSSFPLSSRCVYLGSCWLGKLKHLADITHRVVENVSPWLSAWRSKTRERGKSGQGCKVWAGIFTSVWFSWSSCRKNQIRLSVSASMCVVFCLKQGSPTVVALNYRFLQTEVKITSPKDSTQHIYITLTQLLKI